MATLPETMTAIEITQPGEPDVLKPGTRPMPKPGQGEVLIEVAAAGVNRPDVMQRKGLYPPPPGASDIPGLELAGTVVAVGQGANRFKVGDAVTRAGRRRRLRAILRRARAAMPAGAARLLDGGSGRAAGDVLYRLAQSLRARRAGARRERADPWRVERNRHLRDPIGARVRRRPRSSPPPAAPKNARPASGSARLAPSITRARTLRRGGESRRPGIVASMSCSTWWPATTRRRISISWRWTGGSSSSRSCTAQRPRSTSAACCASG